MHKPFVAVASLLGGLAVILGAFGAHGLERITADEKILQGFRTGVTYQMYHALAMLSLALGYNYFQPARIRWVARCFLLGVILFSGSLYLLTFLKIQESGFVRYIGPVTPLGGMLLILGWLLLLVSALQKK